MQSMWKGRVAEKYYDTHRSQSHYQRHFPPLRHLWKDFQVKTWVEITQSKHALQIKIFTGPETA